jgi:hypothetical protein
LGFASAGGGGAIVVWAAPSPAVALLLLGLLLLGLRRVGLRRVGREEGRLGRLGVGLRRVGLLLGGLRRVGLLLGGLLSLGSRRGRLLRGLLLGRGLGPLFLRLGRLREKSYENREGGEKSPGVCHREGGRFSRFVP